MLPVTSPTTAPVCVPPVSPVTLPDILPTKLVEEIEEKPVPTPPVIVAVPSLNVTPWNSFHF